MKPNGQAKSGIAALRFARIDGCQRPAGSIADWVGKINTLWGRGTGNTLELARVVCVARHKLRYGAWSQLWKTGGVRFSKRKGEMLVVIGQTLGTLDAQNSAQLPSAWNTLYHVARLGRPLVEQLIQQGRIHSRLPLQAARSLLAEHNPQAVPKKTHKSKVKLRLSQFAAYVQATAATWSQEERELAQSQLVRVLEAIGLGLETLANHNAQSQPTAIPHQCIGSPLAIHPLQTPQRI